MPIPDRQKQRREYLKKKAGMYGKGIAEIMVYLSAMIVFFWVGLYLASYAERIVRGIYVIFFVTCVMVVMSLSYRIICTISETNQEVKDAYVPPLTSNTLPAEEVLVRSSQEPEQEQRTMLLRASENAGTLAEELLRASVGKQREV